MISRSVKFVVLASILMSLLISIITGGGLIGPIRYFPLYLAAFSILLITYSIHMQKTRNREIIDGIMKGMKSASYHISASTPLAKALGKAAKSSVNRSSAGILSRASLRIRMGESLFESLTSASTDSKINSSLMQYFKGPSSSVNEAVLIYDQRKKSESAISNALASRYATIGMFVSTVAPSFIIFSFIGGLLVSQANSSISLLSILLTTAIPTSYSAIRLLATR